ncbi:MFS general substrate transporter [Irpex rosettiformis]|uniref:MFS general substrate transporter n=1 Tax=Irpex rosettiformis TaxID=378272 RepID=A0ACB8TZB0_9APHY|nr:MFS general substrate transporter [Irpex rosettiformis]
MSLTQAEVHTLERIRQVNSSDGSLAIHARATHLLEQDATILRKPHPSKDDIELAELSRRGSRSQDAQERTNVAEGTPGATDGVDVNSPEVKLTAWLQYASLCFTLFLAGWNDGTTGPLLPRMQENYHVGYAVVSLIFVLNTVGFVAGAISNVYFAEKIGLGRTMLLGAISQLIGYALMAPAPPFPVLAIGYVFNGFGISLQDAGANGYVASLKDNANVKMGILHAIYGIGAFIAPLSATQFRSLPRWSFQYLISLGIAVVNIVFLHFVFRGKRLEECLAEIGQTRTDATSSSANSDENKYRQIFRLREVHFLAAFICLYVGVEVTVGGWSVSYIEVVRGGGNNSGYVSAGFFGGLTVGRIALLWLNKKIGERNAVFLYAILALGLEFVIWFVPSLIGGALAVSFVGVFLGPIYPLAINHTAKILPHSLLTGSIGWIAGVGQAGSAIVPFITGAIASKAGIASLQPVLIGLMSAMFAVWVIVPRQARHID